MNRVKAAMKWVEDHIPAWIKIVGFFGILIGTLVRVAVNYDRARERLLTLPVQVARLDSLVVQGQMEERLTALESRRDSVTIALREIRGTLEDVVREVGATSAGVDLAVCLVRVQLGERRPLDCRE